MHMSKPALIGIIIAAASAVAVADVLIKKIFSPRTGFLTDIKNPLIFAVVGLYALQILAFSLVFDKKAELGTVGIIQTALYALIVVGSGILFFQEGMSAIKGIGMGLAVLGVILLNL